ncbi:DUF1403 family protein [Xinfangfangia sp. D13-10-4-6]|uniref:DUF1403 family protein n=1 Tax=Pseudogemmobacter hezensis TaxID=2737662 RepID=UPI001551FBC1|nr:DUF1403 family protein [Pseudogemmobacter hezensis]NPD15984.1 DUF1403 family protein [Pseudogemmobacter hezensis]
MTQPQPPSRSASRAKIRPPLPELTAAHPSVPRWLRLAHEGDPGFAAGAALAWLDPLARAMTAPGALWRKRRALAVAEVIAQLDGHRVDQARLRDHWVLRREGDDPGPAAQIYAGCRWLASSRGGRLQDWAAQLPQRFGLQGDQDLVERLHDLALALPQRGAAIAEAASAAEVLITGGPAQSGAARRGLALADAVLARALGWAVPVPLLALGLKRADLRLAGQGAAWRDACARGFAVAALAAADEHADLLRRSEVLLRAAPRLRGRDAAARVAALLDEDALAAGAGAETSDRSARRFYDRLIDAGAVRELTGRATFRLYGL